MSENAEIFLTLGILLLIGLVTDTLGQKTRMPRVTLLILFGLAIGPEFLDLIPTPFQEMYPLVTQVALSMVGFLLGGQLEWSSLKTHGKDVVGLSIAIVLVTAVTVFIGLSLTGVTIAAALVLGAISTSTAPASTFDVVKGSRKQTPFSKILLGIVALDDVWGIMVFSAMSAAAVVVAGAVAEESWVLAFAWELIGAILLGIFLGVPTAYLTGRLQPGKPTLVEALGVVFLCCGIALWLHVSSLFLKSWT